MLATLSAAAAAGLAVGGYFYAGMWPTSQIFGRTILAGRDPPNFSLTPTAGCAFRISWRVYFGPQNETVSLRPEMPAQSGTDVL